MSQSEEKAIASPKEDVRPVPGAKSQEKAGATQKPRESTRDTIESILFAFILAFLFRTFLAEAFVIPTGSMAPTLYGRHKETTCTSCGHRIVVGASHELNTETGLLHSNSRLEAAVCQNCGFENRQIRDELAYNGDRILVNKFPYEFSDPKRWDVFVFKYPSEPKTNYIKRLVGLPNETLRIRNGNLYSVEGTNERILRKPPEKQRRLQIPVYNDDEFPADLVAAGWPERWMPVVEGDDGLVPGWTSTSSGWKADPKNRTYSISTEESNSLAWLRYQHFFPTSADWAAAISGEALRPRARLVGDFCGYNAFIGSRMGQIHGARSVDIGPYWVPDLTLNVEVKIESVQEDGELMLELCEGTSFFRCRLLPKTGEAILEEVNSQMNRRVIELARAKAPIKGAGTYQLAFANVDDRLCLWVNQRLIDFKEGAELPSPGATGNTLPTDHDLSPVGIAAKGISAKVSHLLIERDIYYRVANPSGTFDYLEFELARTVFEPAAWGEFYTQHASQLGSRTLNTGNDEYLAFGDNSPQSNDSRMWDTGHEVVPGDYLVGKAFWIYWPHAIPFLNGGRGFPITYHKELERVPAQRHGQQEVRAVKVKDYPRYTFPFYPQFDRMKRIR
ncbi:signal peptidase I [Planctomicrobium sp. SH668]|uniref:signal peptidase I n=1 Tax=Planctomicrobium sp. SH668 TaxID=3448126 RepID=UPI003F5C9C44